jgi:threonine synthase
MWRYREVLPLLQSSKGLDLPVSLAEGWTPLVRARRLGGQLGLRRLYFKDEGQGPSASWKARGASAAVTRALHLGAQTLCLATSGRAARATAAYAARAALTLRVFVPKDEHLAATTEDASSYGATVTPFEGTLESAERHVATLARSEGWYDCSAGAEPYRLEGQKTIGYELAEQLAWEVPDWILCPAGTGTTLSGLAKAFVEMAALGWIDPVRRPHLVAVQATGCAPLVRAAGTGQERIEPWTAIGTSIPDLRVAVPSAAGLALRAIRDTAGSAIGAGDLEIEREVRTTMQIEGISAAPGAGAALHAVRVLVSEGRIKPHDTVVIVNPGSALPRLKP